MSQTLLDKLSKIYSNSQKCCELIGLDFELDDSSGITRKKAGKSFKYFSPKGVEITDENHLKFINSLRIPPAWEEVWIAPKRKYHLQATGVDSKFRKQYIYHPKWSAFRQLLKFYRLIIIGEALPQIRAEIERNLKKEGYSKEKVLSAIVKIIDTTYIRVGNEQYADENESYGITTLRKKHIEVKGSKVFFDFVGKSSQEQQIVMDDPQIAKIIKKLTSFKGYEVFKYEQDGMTIDIKSSDVNEYIKKISGKKITAKDFRTWGGTKLCFEELKMYDEHLNKTELKKALTYVIDQVSSKLGNTRAVCRSHYIHPQLLFNFEKKSFIGSLNETERKLRVKHNKYMEDDEVLLLAFLKDFFTKEAKQIIS